MHTLSDYSDSMHTLSDYSDSMHTLTYREYSEYSDYSDSMHTLTVERIGARHLIDLRPMPEEVADHFLTVLALSLVCDIRALVRVCNVR
jgi:hypothetical protein